MKVTIFILLSILSTVSYGSESCELQVITKSIRDVVNDRGNYGYREVLEISTLCQKDSGKAISTTLSKDDLGGNTLLGLINQFTNNGFQIVGCEKIDKAQENGHKCIATK